MFPPVPATFTGSMPQQDGPAPRSRVAERSFAALAVVSAAAVCLGAMLPGRAVAWPEVAKAASAALLIPAALGLWATWRTDQAAAGTLAWLYDQVIRRAGAGSASGAVQRPAAEGAHDRFAGLFAGLVLRHRRLEAGHARACTAASASTAALRAGRDQAYQLADCLRGDGAAMADAASGIIAASARLQGETQDARTGADRAGQTVGSLSARAAGLAASVRTVTAQVRQMTAIATGSADAAFGAQANLARLAERATALDRMLDQVSHALQTAAACGRQAANPLDASRVPDDLAANLRQMAICADQALSGTATVIAELRTEAGDASRRVADLCFILHGQQELGIALGHAVEQQGAEISEVLAGLGDAEEGWSALRASVDAIGLSNDARLASAETLRGVADQVPAHAETIARILRSIPDFAPPLQS